MTSITKQAWRIIDEDPSIKKDLARGIINVSGLAAYLKESQGLVGSLDSIISAIRRYQTDATVKSDSENISKAFQDAVVVTKTGITALHLKNSANLYKYLSDLMKDPEFYKSEVFRMLKQRNETLVMIDKEGLRRAKSFFPEGNIVSVETGLALLLVRLPPATWQSKGVLARLANEISNFGVSIRFIVSAEPHISIFVTEKDLTTAHNAVLSLTH